jgi:hypothetical protein
MVSPPDHEGAGRLTRADASGSPHRGSTGPERRLPTAANFLRDGCQRRLHGCADSCLLVWHGGAGRRGSALVRLEPSLRFSLSDTDQSSKFGGHVVGGLSLQG